MQARRSITKQVRDYQNPKKNNQFSPSPIKRYVSSKSFSHHQSQSNQAHDNLNKENLNGNQSIKDANLSSAPSFSQSRGRRKPLQQLFNELSSHNSADYGKVDINRKVSDLLKLESKGPISSIKQNQNTKSHTDQAALDIQPKDSQNETVLKEHNQGTKQEDLKKRPSEILNSKKKRVEKQESKNQSVDQSVINQDLNSENLKQDQLNSNQEATMMAQVQNQNKDRVVVVPDSQDLQLISNTNQNIDQDQDMVQQTNLEQESSSDASYQNENSKDLAEFENQDSQDDCDMDMGSVSDQQHPQRSHINLTQNTLIVPNPNNPNAMQYSGRWTDEEHEKFLVGLKIYGKDWRLIEEYIGSRTCAQIRSHAQKYFNKLNRNSSKRAQKLLAEKQTLGKRVHQEPRQSQQVPVTQKEQLTTTPLSQPKVLPNLDQIKSITQAPSNLFINKPENLNLSSIKEQTREQMSKIHENFEKITESELHIQLQALIQQREKVSLNFLLKQISSVDACRILIQITNQFHEQAMKALKSCKFELSNRMVDERNLTQFICILLSKQVQILPPSAQNQANPEEDIIQHVTATHSQGSQIDNDVELRSQANTLQKRPKIQEKTPDQFQTRFMQPNFNLGRDSITPFRSLVKTPNPIHRLLPDDNKLSEIKSDLLIKNILGGGNNFDMNLLSGIIPASVSASAQKQIGGIISSDKKNKQ